MDALRVFSVRVFLGILILAFSATDVNAQHHAKKGIQLGAKIGVSSYNGDITSVLPGENQYDLTFEGELFYRFSRWFGVGMKQSFGKYPEISTTEGQRTSTAIAIRTYLLSKRLSPYIQLGASRSSGGAEAGYGVALATGFELEISRYVSLFQDISFDQVLPDRALDGLTGGRKYDLFGRLGGGFRFNLVRGRKVFRLADIDQPDSLMVGELGEFTIALDGIEESEVNFKWDLPGGVVYTENPIRHSFSNPGLYEMHLSVASKNELINEVIHVNVYRPFVEDTVVVTETIQKSARIESLSGDTALLVGEEGVFRMRIKTGAEWPIQYEWDMGDGSIYVGNYVVHRFENPGVYRVRGSAVNSYGDDTSELMVEVTRGDVTTVVEVVPDEPQDSVPIAVTEPVPPVTDAGVDTAENTVPEEVTPPVADTSVASDASETDLSVSDTKRTPVAAPNPDRNVSRIAFTQGGYTWVVESLDTSSEAATRAEDYKYLGFPYGYKRDPDTGNYNVMVGQFESEWVALRVSWRIQQHAPRRIWLTEVK